MSLQRSPALENKIQSFGNKIKGEGQKSECALSVICITIRIAQIKKDTAFRNSFYVHILLKLLNGDQV